MELKILSLNIGSISTLNSRQGPVKTGYGKKSVPQAELGELGFVGDRQADLENHGGRDKAICVFSAHHFTAYQDFLGIEEMGTPAFGENLTVDYAAEDQVFIGDVFTCGAVSLQVSQPRQPCSKTGLYHKNNKVIKYMSETGATGFYFRVITSGLLKEGDCFVRTKKAGNYSLELANDIMYRRQKDQGLLQRFIAYSALSQAWKDELSSKIK
jgi:MOSC domain-containing protein YiiM